MTNYMHSLAAGTVQPSARQAELLAQAANRGLITRAKADTFHTVRGAVEQWLAKHPEELSSGAYATAREAAVLVEATGVLAKFLAD